jgi:hypothetical protein
MADIIKCSNCGNYIAASSKSCQHCEAPVRDEPRDDRKQFVQDVVEKMDPETHQGLTDAFNSSETAEEFVNNILVGPCPICGRVNTGDCDNDPEIEDPFVGRCLDCGYHWCTECGRRLDATKPCCTCWDEDVRDE